MDQIFVLKHMKLNVASLQLCLIMLFSFTPVSWGDELELATNSTCEFTSFLENAENRGRYESMVSRGRFKYTTVSSHENAAIYVVIAKSGYSVEMAKNLDSFSAGCLACHDGKSASKVRPTIVNNPVKKDAISVKSVKHPIGMDYEKYSASNRTLKTLDQMSQNLSLVEGRVSCVTCHDPLNPARNHLRVTKTGIDLCAACHIL